ncbi:MAG: TetR/AcrR family transcriptional regulator [Lachnospiraceae bacterium]|jgi:AcrR family transcriptional regulator|nr:TetR/AcrR family transcriptional regulator [Lachnospiraceae bacterium]
MVKEKGPGKAEANKKAKKDALLNAAFDLFTKQGINKTSISDIVDHAKVAKGTFYLYFSDKYDLRNFLIAHKAGQIFLKAKQAADMDGADSSKNVSLEDRIAFFLSNIIDQFTDDPTLVRFLSKNLSWGMFKHDLASINDSSEIDFMAVFEKAFSESDVQYKNPEVMLFEIIELVGSTSYSSILYGEPLPISELKPFLLEAARSIMKSQEVGRL